MPFYFFIPFLVKWLQAYLRSKNTPLLFKELNVINYLLCTPLLLKEWNDKSPHEITLIKGNIN
jgi:hypothetical protein